MTRFFNLKLHNEGGAGVEGIGTLPANDSPAPVVAYGKPDPAIETSKPATAPAEEVVVDRSSEYSKAKELYKDLYEADVRGHIDRRLKGTKKELVELQATVDPILKFFNLETIKDLKDFALSDLAAQIPGGYTPPTFEDTGDEGAQPAEVAVSPADLATQATALTEKFPDFNLEAELPALEPLVKRGLSLEQAYKAVKFDEILQKETLKAAETQKRLTIEAIRTRGINQVDETVSKPSPAVQHKSDPNQYTDEDLLKINDLVRMGAKIRL